MNHQRQQDDASATDGIVSLSVLIPVYNEEDILDRTVGDVVRAVRAMDAVESFEVIIAENGSSDASRALAAALVERYEEVIVIESAIADYGAALRDGFKAAKGDFIVNFDADYYDFEFLERALELRTDVVIAAKGIAGSHDARVVVRRVASRCFSFLIRSLLDVHVTETHGMKLFRRSSISPLLPKVKSLKDLFDTELVARADRSGLLIAELPIRTQEMRHSRSGIARRIPRTLLGLLKLRRSLRAEAVAGRRAMDEVPSSVSS